MTVPSLIEAVRRRAERLHSAAEVDAAITRMAAAITADWADANPVVLCILNGAIVVTGRLLPRLDFPLELDSVHATRYGRETRGGDLHWLHTPRTDLCGRNVLLVDDVLDEGVTLAAIRDYCLEQGARAVRIAVLVDKKLPNPKPCRADYVGLVCDNRYIFGCGMDYQGYWRNLPDIYAVKERQS
ncbi:hypoxanthine phosphoribosyltransferase [Methylomarinovum caldicuralii]|uniref:Hypoxanthine phosphoribosyltransferase n=1 Tax=Methylomarinovum caldicuralii TaxID=438856 RepID=A0AAU9C714_9GAMM|nr:hypoxanthine-guanine phosphoribosyltransferase [Methylomarinovum caldicuralii]BCX82980.1 hypoxanthine phosphoribosyltransferase [Methylomarinovum caldicuralii]